MEQQTHTAAGRHDIQTQTRILNGTFISIFITNMFDALGRQTCNGIIGLYAHSFGVAATLVGTVAGVFAVTSLLFKFISAPMIDTFNRKHILLFGMMFLGVSMIGLGLSRTLRAVMFFRLLQGAGMAFCTTCCLALAADALPPDRIATGIGYYSLAQAACMSVGPAMGLKIAYSAGFPAAFFTAACLFFTGAFASTRIKLTHVRTKKFRLSLDNMIARESLLPATIMIFLSMAYSNTNSFLAIYGRERGVGSDIGFFFTVYAISLFLSRPITGPLSEKYGHVKVLIPAMICFASAFYLISISTTLRMFLAAAFVSAFGYGCCQPVMQALCMQLAPKEKRGAAASTCIICTNTGTLIGPVFAGMVIDRFGFAVMWRVMTAPIIAAIACTLLFRGRFPAYGNKKKAV